jgi:hypothetical protein
MIAVLVAGYVIITIRVALGMRRIGRSFRVWFVISLFLTALPALVVLIWHHYGWLFRGEPTPEDHQKDIVP